MVNFPRAGAGTPALERSQFLAQPAEDAIWDAVAEALQQPQVLAEE